MQTNEDRRKTLELDDGTVMLLAAFFDIDNSIPDRSVALLTKAQYFIDYITQKNDVTVPESRQALRLVQMIYRLLDELKPDDFYAKDLYLMADKVAAAFRLAAHL